MTTEDADGENNVPVDEFMEQVNTTIDRKTASAKKDIENNVAQEVQDKVEVVLGRNELKGIIDSTNFDERLSRYKTVAKDDIEKLKDELSKVSYNDLTKEDVKSIRAKIDAAFEMERMLEAHSAREYPTGQPSSIKDTSKKALTLDEILQNPEKFKEDVFHTDSEGKRIFETQLDDKEYDMSEMGNWMDRTHVDNMLDAQKEYSDSLSRNRRHAQRFRKRL